MFQIKCFLVCFLSYFILESDAGNVDVSFIKPCRPHDEACLIQSAQAAVPYFAAGIPELGIPASDPLVIKSIHSEENNLKLTFTNNHITGPGKSKILKLERDTDKQVIKIVVETPLTVVGQYDLQGSILFIRALGNGDYNLKTNNIRVSADLKYKIIEKNGNKYWKITGFEYSYDLLEKVYMKLNNLFGGDEEAAKPIHHLFDVSWREVITELGDPIFKQVVTGYVNNIKKLFLEIPYNKLEIA